MKIYGTPADKAPVGILIGEDVLAPEIPKLPAKYGRPRPYLKRKKGRA